MLARAPRRLYFGWMVVAAAFCVLAVAYGMQFSYGVFMPSMAADLGWDRATLSAPFSLFVLLYTPCLVALVTVIRELKSWRWSIFSVAYQLTLAWCAATVVYQAGMLLGLP